MSTADLDEKQQTVTRWIVEYAVFVVWNDFVKHKTVDRNNNRDLIQCTYTINIFFCFRKRIGCLKLKQML